MPPKSESEIRLDLAIAQFLPEARILSHVIQGKADPVATFGFEPDSPAAVCWKISLMGQSRIFPLEPATKDKTRPEYAVRTYLNGKRSSSTSAFPAGIGVAWWTPDGFKIAPAVVSSTPNLSRSIDSGVLEEIAKLEDWVFGTGIIFKGIPTPARMNLIAQIKKLYRDKKAKAFHVLMRIHWNLQEFLGPDAAVISDPFSYKGTRFVVAAVPTFKKRVSRKPVKK